MKRVKHRERGTTLPETAIVVAVLLALVFGIIEFGRAVYTYGLVADMARKGARWAIVRGNLCTKLGDPIKYPSPPYSPSYGCPAANQDVVAYVQGLSEGATNPAAITVVPNWPGTGITCTPTNGFNSSGCPVTVTVKYPFSFIAPYMPGIPTIMMSSTSTMIISQ